MRAGAYDDEFEQLVFSGRSTRTVQHFVDIAVPEKDCAKGLTPRLDSTVSVRSSYTLSKSYPRAPKTERAQVRIWHGTCFARIRCVPFVPLV